MTNTVKLVTPSEAAIRLGVSRQQIHKWLAQNRIPHQLITNGERVIAYGIAPDDVKKPDVDKRGPRPVCRTKTGKKKLPRPPALQPPKREPPKPKPVTPPPTPPKPKKTRKKSKT